MLTSLSLTRSNESRVEPRVAVSNNNCTVRFYDVSLRISAGGGQRLDEVGCLTLDVPVNHSSVSPDGRTLLSVGDSPQVYMHHISGGSKPNFEPITKLALPVSSTSSPIPMYTYYTYGSGPSPPASFSTTFSASGSKFAVASQEGMVVVWDVRSSKPMKTFYSDRTRVSIRTRRASGAASGWMYEEVFDPAEWNRGGPGGKAPGWGLRSVKFGGHGEGKEILTFTEHTSLLHVIDAKTFETEEVIRVPSTNARPAPSIRPRSRSPPPRYPLPASSSSRLTSGSGFPPPLPRVVLFNGGHRVPSPIPSWRPRWRPSSAVRATANRVDEYLNVNEGVDEEGVVVIPPLGDRTEEEDVRALLGRHGLRARAAREIEPSWGRLSRRAYDPQFGDVEMDDDRDGEREEDRDVDMEVDELEGDVDVRETEVDTDICLSREPSRANSPAPTSSSTSIHVSIPAQPSTSRRPASSSGWSAPEPIRFPSRSTARDRDTYRLAVPSVVDHRRSRRRSESLRDVDVVYEEEDVDLAGVCFDPTGSWLYAASTSGIVEWKVRGASKSWWNAGQWI
ncbi:hypothetical protein JAAARDRAFT_439184 [Jaapia argillacea MUCL 33604]|uniref:DUF2415 domain-containing protein n=1 Tax=Jaapia argillacea MUCL 33604 TaxID=933084 RepID=A0A067PEA9_9AGAM|nr:hypothetical protein JAAARDRAFT_439184 [Jaapia argillacea MUCL 33604]